MSANSPGDVREHRGAGVGAGAGLAPGDHGQHTESPGAQSNHKLPLGKPANMTLVMQE